MKIYFIGIGGIGVSALARYYLKKGHGVSGSDLIATEITKALKKEGAKISIGKHKASNVKKDTNLVIYTFAAPKENPELREARKLKIKTKTYPEALGDLTKKYFTIAISGTHGKSTTSSMAGILLKEAGLDPTVLIGTKLKEFGDSNCRVGKSRYLVIEADEYGSAFLNYWPKIIALTTLEKEHLDYFKNEKNIFNVFKKYISHLPKDGVLIANKDDENISKLKSHIANPKFKIKNYSLKQKSDVVKVKKTLKVPGIHNISNALAVLNIARTLGISEKITLKALSKYKGAWRRFEIIPSKINNTSYTLISDYGHHPTEIKATLQAAREKYKKKRIILVYQPHQYQRTKLLFKDFVKSFDEADYLILNEIYGVAGREKGNLVSSKNLTEAVNKRWRKGKPVEFFKNQGDILKKLSKIIKKGDILIVMGAGDIYNLTLKFTKNLKKK
ncbi:MAG: UDP-N-acetylmuramate--L-alanine ligase [Candidatus Pacebacteria bacterium]|nr:UDP-N-acetylmuramate--L-alanine ligase [Candidatus Paceibacterota bacterium]